MRELFFLFILIMASIIDYKNREIPNKLIAISIIIGLYINLFIFSHSTVYIYISALLFIFFIFTPINELGGADKKIIALTPLYLTSNTGLYFFILSILYIALYLYFHMKHKAKKSIIFAPILLLCYIITLILKG